jgi:hypothetical protein
MFLEFLEASCPPSFHGLNALADAFEHTRFFGHLAKLLISGCVLNDQLGLTVVVRTTGSPVCFN